MGKTFDKIILSLLAALVLFLGFYAFTDSYLSSAICSILFCGIVMLVRGIKRPKTPKNKMSKREFVRTVLLNGNSYLKSRTERALRAICLVGDADGNTLVEKDGKKAIVYYAYKFGSLSEEDVAKSYRLACAYGAETIYALTSHTERKALAVTAYIPQKFVIVSAGTLYKYLLRAGLIPEKEKGKKEGKKAGAILRSALTARNAKYFIFAGFSTALVALLTPFAAYYVAFAFVNLILAALSIFFSEKDQGKNDLFS